MNIRILIARLKSVKCNMMANATYEDVHLDVHAISIAINYLERMEKLLSDLWGV